ncbi:MAG: paraquat-inducible membrane protein A [Candidatus Omnitrophica bacterium CG11_big_fil_rev_8_21_14_0_20_63_9]|nr:MAG: paraquat-inducible membrane protein A [Candidatus Omnitrophica bacterium CG11_big_fil_rev_8_21_14_0_20_63_9]
MPRPPSTHRRALRQLYSAAHTVVVALTILLSTGLLVTGLSLPLLHAQQMIFWKSEYSVWTGVVALWHANELALAAILFFFSIIFPFVKLVGLVIIWFWKLPETKRTTLLHWLGLLGKWSMLDVFIVAILIVLVKLGPMAKVEPRVGVYVFTAAILASMLTTMYVDRLAKQAG